MLNFLKDKSNISSGYLTTFVTEFFVLCSGILVYRFASSTFGTEGFSQYAICRRTISFIYPVLMLGFAVGIPRYIAFGNSEENPAKSNTYLISGLIITASVSIFALLILNLLSPQFSFLFFGDKKFEILILPMSVLIFGLVLHALCYSYFRGKLFMTSANIIQMINQALIPVFIFAFKFSVAKTLLITGVASAVISLGFLIFILSDLKWSRKLLLPTSRELLAYGVQRIPGDIALAGFFAMPAYIVAHTADLTTAGYVAFGVSIMNIVGTAFGPISLLLLPKSVTYIANENYLELRRHTSHILVVSLWLTALGVLIFELFTGWFIRVYLGTESPDLIFIVRVIMLASIGYVVYVVLRSVLDAYHFRAVNTKNIFISFMIFLTIIFISWMLKADFRMVIYAFTFSIFILGLMTYSEYKNIFEKKIS